MKSEYPRYEKGSLQKIKKKLNPKNKQILKEFLKVCSIEAGEGKIKKIERFLLQFYDITEIDLDKQTKESVNSWLIVLNKSDRSFWTRNEFKGYVKKFLKGYYKDLELIENIKRSKKDRKRINDTKINENNLITPEELEKMIRQTESFRQKALILLLWETGGRPQEIVNLKWRDIKFKDSYGNITLYSNKTGTTRTFPIKETCIHLKRWKQEFCFPNVKESDFVFPTPLNRSKPITTTAINNMLKKVSKRAGINRHIWSYLFRHTRATRLYEELPQQIVEKLMGHKDMAGIYAHISDKKAREEMLNKIYKIEELTEEEKDKYDKLIKELKQQLTDDKKIILLNEQRQQVFKKNWRDYTEQADAQVLKLAGEIKKLKGRSK